MSNKDTPRKMGEKLLYKIMVYLVSFSIVAGVIGVVLSIQSKRNEEEAARIEAAEEATKEAAKGALTQEEIEELFKEHKTEEVEVPTEEAGTIESTEVDAEMAIEEIKAVVDWEGLWEINSDVYAWISIPGTSIDYPILQHSSDNTYYLNYNIDGSYGYPGCIYTENLNSKDFTDNNTVIYGHNMKNGTMFAGLHQFEDSSFFTQNDKIYIYTPGKELTYTIFAAYIYDDRHLLYSFDFTNEDVYAAYLEEIFTRRDLSTNIRTDINVTKEDNIITLVTCMSKQPDKRLLVQAVLEK